MEHSKIQSDSTVSVERNTFKFKKISSVKPLKDYQLEITFEEGSIKTYDVATLFSDRYEFRALRDEPGLFELVKIEPGGYAVRWNDEIDLSCDELWFNSR